MLKPVSFKYSLCLQHYNWESLTEHPSGITKYTGSECALVQKVL